MIRSIGKFSKSILVKIFVGIIILPFIFWGMGDVFRGGNQNVVASVESEKISSKEFINYLNRLNISETDFKNIKSTNLVEKVLNEYIGRKLVNLEFERLGIYVSDQSLREIIKNDRTFFKNDKFSRTEYEKFLLKSSMSAPMFEANLAEQEKRRQLLTFLSGGIKIPEFLIQKEFQKENQIKTIKYLDLNNFYKKDKPKEEELENIFNESKDFFVEELKNISYAELSPISLTGKNEFNENYFGKIDQIENNILDGKDFNEIVKDNNLKITLIKNINRNTPSLKDLEKKIFDKVFQLKIKNSILIEIDNKFYVAEVTSIDKKKKSLKDKDVRDIISTQINLQNKFEKNTKISQDINSGKFDYLKMKSFAQKNNLEIKDLTIRSLKDTQIFKEDSIKKIFNTENEKLNLISDGLLDNNYIIYVEKTQFKNLDKNNENYNSYKMKAQLNLSKEIYELYDKSVNNKYKIEVNKKVVERIKNSF